VRKEFAEKIKEVSSTHNNIIFVTGDLGFNALEEVQTLLQDKFINAGVAEQNMIGLASGMAYEGYKVFCYSIAPFIVYRCLEQTRNDVCFHNLPVFLVGNGGGYGYGIMGASHHCLEDLACLSSLPNMQCWIPAFTDDLPFIIDQIVSDNTPAYLRLGLGLRNPFQQSKYLGYLNYIHQAEDAKITIIALGPVVNNVIKALQDEGLTQNADIFTAYKLPITEMPEELKRSLAKSKKCMVVEEHVSTGGLGERIALLILQHSIILDIYLHLHAKGYPSGLYGNQDFHQQDSQLDAAFIANLLRTSL
jgi:transketolase